MSIQLIENEIRRFLSTPEPEVICISGHWGVGKTFAWNRFLKDAKAKNDIALTRYSYDSLFGVGSLDEFKYSVFENSVNASQIGVEPSLESLQSNTLAAVERTWGPGSPSHNSRPRPGSGRGTSPPSSNDAQGCRGS